MQWLSIPWVQAFLQAQSSLAVYTNIDAGLNELNIRP
jgi:hypothetical protein